MFGRNKIYRIRDFENNDKLIIKQIFLTIQGEGPYAGQVATFIRTGHCSLKCDFCDTDFSDNLRELTVDDIINEVLNITPSHCKLIVLTGGEPMIQPLIGELIQKLINNGFKVQIETSGSVCVDTIPFGNMELTTICSPKTGKLDNNIEDYIDHYKYVINHKQIDDLDGLPLNIAKPKNSSIPIWISPMDNYDEHENALNIKAVVAIAIKFGYRISLQTHKYLNVE